MRLWILGASDPEMNVIEDLLRATEEVFAYALDARGERVSPATAYKAVKASAEIPADATVYFVECKIDGLTEVVRIDHHRPGDPGFGRGPGEFLAASSVGQVIRVLASVAGEKLAAICEPRLKFYRAEAPRGLESVGDFASSAEVGWVVRSSAGDLIVPSEVVYAAASDHCLAAAYRGECPMVDAENLMAWRASVRAKHQGITVEALLSRIGGALDALRIAERVDLGGGQVVADLRDREVPELPEAAARDGRAYLATVTEREGRRKIVLGGHTNPATVKAFLEIWAPAQGLADLYGDPARGFAGGYLP